MRRRTTEGKSYKVHILICLVIIFAITLSSTLVDVLDVFKYRDTGIKDDSNLNTHNYDWSYLENVDCKKHYVDKDGQKALLGIDVSRHQGEIDWEKVKNQNIEFAMIRVGYRGYESGEIVKDDMFISNIEGASEADIEVGVYFFSQAKSIREAEEEAKFVLDAIKNHDVKFPIVFDMEHIEGGRIKDLSIKERTKAALVFCERIEKEGYSAMIYGSTSWLQNAVLLLDISKYDLWVSEYSNELSFPHEFHMWQYTNEGKIDGISGNVDLNLCFKQYVN